MSDDRWQRVAALYQAAQDQAAEERSSFVKQAAAGDSDLRRDVESLLALDGRAVAIDEHIAAVARSLLADNPGVQPGSFIGPYRVDSLLGVGGMGEVYRARDTKLNRDVAIKILPPAFANDPDRLARFKREAQVLASLNHSNIAAIYGLEDSGDVHALVLELVEGATLADRILCGPLPIDEALKIAKQIAEALEAAHEHGIIHRDLKPANIKVRDEGTVKVLDFGLAKALEPTGAMSTNVLMSPTITSPAMTEAGMILGTASYMSPEQAVGKPVDKRSDLWAFGVVLLEMLMGRQVFHGETVSHVLASVLKDEPDWTALPANTATSIRRLLRRCLEKDRRKRLADISDARLEIEDAQLESTNKSGSVAAEARVRWFVPWSAGLTALAVAIVVGIIAADRRPAAIPETVRFDIAVPSDWTSVLPASLGPSAGTSLAISPDGRHVVFGAANPQGHVALWLRSLDRVAARELPDTEGAAGPFWSADSRFVGFYAAGKLRKIEISTATVTTLCEIPSFNGATWNPEGVIVLARAGGSGGPLLRVPDSGGIPTPATKLQPGEILHTRPAFLPDGRHFLYRTTEAVSNGSIVVGSLDSSERKVIVNNTTTGRVVYANGYLLFMQGTTLVAQAFDPNGLSVTGPVIPVAQDVQTTSSIPPVGVFSASDTGVLVYRTGQSAIGSQLAWLDRAGKTVSTLGTRGDYTDLELAPDGMRASISVRDAPQQRRDIWLIDTVRGLPVRFTNDPADEATSIWSPDGSRIVFNSNRQGAFDLYEKAADAGTDETALVPREPNPALERTPLSWSPDGNAILFGVTSRFDREPGFGGNGVGVGELWVLPLSGNRKPVPFLKTPINVAQGRFSPNGHWIAYTSAEAGSPQVYVTAFPGPAGKSRISPEGGTFPRWRQDGKELFFVGSNAIWAATVNTVGTSFQLGSVHRLFPVRISGPWSNYDVAPDGQRFLVNMQPEAQPAGTAMTVTQNWFEELKSRVPAK